MAGPSIEDIMAMAQKAQEDLPNAKDVIWKASSTNIFMIGITGILDPYLNLSAGINSLVP